MQTQSTQETSSGILNKDGNIVRVDNYRNQRNIRRAAMYLSKAKNAILYHEVPIEAHLRKQIWAANLMKNQELRREFNTKSFCSPSTSTSKRTRSSDDEIHPPEKKIAVTELITQIEEKTDLCSSNSSNISTSSNETNKISKIDLWLQSSIVEKEPREKTTSIEEIPYLCSSDSGNLSTSSSETNKDKDSSKLCQGSNVENELKDMFTPDSRNLFLSSNHHQPITFKSFISEAKLKPISIKKEENSDEFDIADSPSFKTLIQNIVNLPYSEIIKLYLKVSIVDANAHDLKMSVGNFLKIESLIQEEMYERISNGIPTSFSFQMKEIYKGFMIINCDSEDGLQFLKSTVSKLGEVWPKSKLEVRHLQELSATIKVNIPVNHMNAKFMVGLLIANNRELPISKWDLVAYGRSIDGMTPVIFRIDLMSAKLLEEKKFDINFGIRSVAVKLLKSSSQSFIAVEDVCIGDIQNSVVENISSLFNEKLEFDKDFEE